jgi:hypothetical protein
LEAAATEHEFILDFPLYSSRRTWGLNRLVPPSSAEPALFFAQNPQPLFSLPAREETAEAVDWFNLQGDERSTAGSYTYIVTPGSGATRADNFFVDNWGIHPATPVPTPIPRSGVMIDRRVTPVAGVQLADEPQPAAEEAAGEASTFEVAELRTASADHTHRELELGQGEAAKVILELMETLGRSVLDGTVFQKPSPADEQWLKELDANQVSPREALIQYIRALEAHERKTSELQQPPLAELPAPQVAELPDERISLVAEEIEIGIDGDDARGEDDQSEDDQDDEVESLRLASEELETLANRLERKNNYLRADQVRDLANQLRFDARRVQQGDVEAPISPLSIDGYSMPVGAPFPMYGPMVPPMMQPVHGLPASPFGPMMPGALPPGISPTPQPTFERPQRDSHDLERQIQALRDELRRTRQSLGEREEKATLR